MKFSSSDTNKNHVIDINWADRWQVYQRLQELDITCICEINEPLTVEIKNTTTAIQIWSVVKRFTASRQDLIENLEKSWRSPYQNFS
ncbi:MAG: Asr1405/Asl0597 family protein [Cuspidothrix sp.]